MSADAPRIPPRLIEKNPELRSDQRGVILETAERLAVGYMRTQMHLPPEALQSVGRISVAMAVDLYVASCDAVPEPPL